MSVTLQTARRIVVAIIGGSVVTVGLVMILAPGPALLVIPLGLSILATEFAFARRWLRRLRQAIRSETATPASEEGEDGGEGGPEAEEPREP